ncbi:hypothetical protein LTR62_002905 [Meristemomyces frigidus]|uniref:SnoaL-like domain-containing protein n=1 Tax=Meristemomyces frigidus TaxID=1508187 RepID=A0AAN7TPH7_9PEZI|nr:hypothetical protein LTR62_002905 [Meristemomyces frigidus]
MATSHLANNMRATSEAFLQAWDTWEVESIMAIRAPECTHSMLPVNVGFDARTNAEFGAYLKTVGGFFTKSKMTMNDYVAVPAERRAVVRSTMLADAPWGEFRNEYVWFLRFTEDGLLVTEIIEFIDSLTTRDVKAKIIEHVEGEKSTN